MNDTTTAIVVAAVVPPPWSTTYSTKPVGRPTCSCCWLMAARPLSPQIHGDESSISSKAAYPLCSELAHGEGSANPEASPEEGGAMALHARATQEAGCIVMSLLHWSEPWAMVRSQGLLRRLMVLLLLLSTVVEPPVEGGVLPVTEAAVDVDDHDDRTSWEE